MTSHATPRRPDAHEPTPTDFMIFRQWPAELPLKPVRPPLPMLPMPPIRPRTPAPRRRGALVTLRMATRHPIEGRSEATSQRPRGSRRGLSPRARIAAFAASTLVCGALFASAMLWLTHHASAPAGARLALEQNTPSA